MSYRLTFSRRAAAYLERLDLATQQRMRTALTVLAENRYGGNTKKLKGPAGQRSLRVGGWRVIYFISQDEKHVFVDAIGPRGQVYRDL